MDGRASRRWKGSPGRGPVLAGVDQIGMDGGGLGLLAPGVYDQPAGSHFSAAALAVSSWCEANASASWGLAGIESGEVAAVARSES